MTQKKENSLPVAIRGCIRKIKETRAGAFPVLKQMEEGKLDRDYLDKTRVFLNDFETVKNAIDTLPIENGVITVQMPEDERKEAEKLFPVLISEVEKLAEAQKEIIELFRSRMMQNQEKMKIIRDAKSIFEKFVKKKTDGARFFDKQG